MGWTPFEIGSFLPLIGILSTSLGEGNESENVQMAYDLDVAACAMIW